MFVLFCCFFGICIGFFFALNIINNRNITLIEKWWTALVASILISFNAVLLVINLKEFFK